MPTPFFHFGPSESASKSDSFVYIGNSTLSVLSSNITPPSAWDDAVSSNRVRWFAFNQKELFSIIELSDGQSQVDWLISPPPPPTDDDALDQDIARFLTNNKSCQPRVVFGPENTCVAWSLEQLNMGGPRSWSRWSSSAQADAVKEVLANPWTGFPSTRIQFIALGVDGSYYVKYESETGNEPAYDFKGKYSALQQCLDGDPRPEVEFLALHPADPNQFFLVLSNLKVRARVSISIRDKLEAALAKERDTGMEINIETVD